MKAIPGLLFVWRHALGRSLRGKRVIVLALLACMPVVVAALNIASDRPVGLDHFMEMVFHGVFRFIIPITALFLGVAVLGDEIEGRTITYLFTRPLPRPVFFLGRLAGFVSAFALILCAALLAMSLIFRAEVELSAREIAGTIDIAVLGLVAYTCFFAALRAITRRAVFIGFLLCFVLEFWFASLPASALSRWSVWHHLALLQSRLFEPRVFSQNALQGIAATETVSGSLWTLGGVLLVSLAVGSWIVHSREVNVPAAVA